MTIQLYGLEQRHWKALSKISTGLITPDEFLSLYPNTTRAELAKICQCSESTVAHWFVRGTSKLKPKQSHLLWLTLAHHCLQRVEKSFRENRQNQMISR